MDLEQRLSANFTLRELIESSTAARLGIDNTPNDDEIEKLRWLAGQLEMPRELLGPLHVDSGLRVEALEKVLCKDAFLAWCKRHGEDPKTAWPEYLAGKQHPACEAADLKSLVLVPGKNFVIPPIEMCRRIAASDIPFDQLIYEFDSWMHLSFAYPPNVPRREVLTINASGTKIGLVESVEKEVSA